MPEPPHGPVSEGPCEASSQTPRRRRRWAIRDKERLVQQASEHGASIASVARSVGVPASQISAWKAQFLRKQAHLSVKEDVGDRPPRQAEACAFEVWVTGECLLDDATTGQLQELGPAWVRLRRNQLVFCLQDETTALRYLAFLQGRGVDARFMQS